MSDRPPPKTPPIILPPVTIDSPAFTDINGRVWTWGRWFVLNWYQRILVTNGQNPYTALPLTGDEETSHRAEDNIGNATPGSTGTKCECSVSSNEEVAAMAEDANQPGTSGVSTQTASGTAVPTSAEASDSDNQLNNVAEISAEPTTSCAIPTTEDNNGETASGLQAAESSASSSNPGNETDLLAARSGGSEQTPMDESEMADTMKDEMQTTVAAVNTMDEGASSSADVQEVSRAAAGVEDDTTVQGTSDSPGPTIDEDPVEQEAEEEETPMEVVETHSPEIVVVPHVINSEQVLETAYEITTDVPSVSVEVTIETTEGISEDNVEPQSSSGSSRTSLNDTNGESEQASTSSAPIVENRSSELESLNRTNELLGIDVVVQLAEGEQSNANNADDNIPTEVDEIAPGDQRMGHGDERDVAASSQIHETADTAQAHIPEEELMEVTNEDREEGKEEKHNMNDDEPTKETEENIKENTDTRRFYEQFKREGDWLTRPAAFNEPSTSSGQITIYAPLNGSQQESSTYSGQLASSERSTSRPGSNELYDIHRDSNAIRNLIQSKKTSAWNEPSTPFEESQEFQRAIEESLRSASTTNIDLLESTGQVANVPARIDPITSTAYPDDNQEVQEIGDRRLNEAEPCTSSAQQDCHQDVQIENDSNRTNIDHLEGTSQVTNVPAQNDPITSNTHFDNNQETDQVESMGAPESDQDVPSSSSANYNDNQEDQQNNIENSTRADQVEKMEASESNQDDPSTSPTYSDEHQEDQKTDIENSTHAVQVESATANAPSSTTTDLDNGQEAQATDDEYLSDQSENPRHGVMAASRNESCSSSAHFEDYQEMQEDDDEISNHANQSENTSHATERPVESSSSSANYYNYREVENSNHADQFESTRNVTMNAASNEPCTSTAYYGSYRDDHRDGSGRSAHVDQFEPTTSSAPYEVLQEVRENIEGSSYQFGSMERPRNRPSYDEPSTSSDYYYGHQEVQRNVVDCSREDNHFEDLRRSTRINVPSTSAAYYNDYQEVQINEIGNLEPVHEFERVERPRTRPAYINSTRSPVYGNQEIRRNVVDSSRDVDFSDNRRRSTRTRTPNVRSVSPAYHNTYQENQRNSTGSSRNVHQDSRKRPAQNEPNTSLAFYEDYDNYNRNAPRNIPQRSRTVQSREEMKRSFERTLTDQPSISPEISGVRDPNESVRDYLIRTNSLRSNALSVRPINHGVYNGQQEARQQAARNSTRNLVQECQQQYSQRPNQRQPPTLQDDYDRKTNNQPVESEAVDAESPKPTKKYERFVLQKRKEHHLTRAKTAELGLTPDVPMKKKLTPSRKRERSDSDSSDWSPDSEKKKPGKKKSKKGKK